MKTNLHRNCVIHLSLLGALACSAPLAALAHDRTENEHFAKLGARVERDGSIRRESRSSVVRDHATVSKEYVRNRIEELKIRDPRHLKAHACFEPLLDAGYDPVILDGWLDALDEGVIVAGMPTDIVLSYYGEPVFRHEVVFAGAPAFEWGIRVTPARIEKVTVVHNKVVRVRT